MAEGITGYPNQYDAGLDFDYSVWTAGTQVDLVNVPWNNDYRDVVKFDSRDELNAYIDGLHSAGTRIQNMTYAKPGEDIYLGIPYNRVNRYNYLRASNPLMPIPGDIQKEFYYFILGCEYVNATTTRLRLQLDVWQTYVYDVTFGNCYVERGHIGIANENQFFDFGRTYLTTPEGLDVGGEYVIAWQEREKIANTWHHASQPADTDFSIVVCSTVDLLDDAGTVANPILTSAKGSEFSNIPSGAAFYGFEHFASFTSWLNLMSSKPWVTQGIISVTITPNLKRYIPTIVWQANTPVNLSGRSRLNSLTHALKPEWRNSTDITSYVDERYRHLKKLLTYPYMVIEITTWQGSPIIIKPEAWYSNDASVKEMAAFAPPNQRIVFAPLGYNGKSLTITPDDPIEGPSDQGEFLDMAVAINALPQSAVVNNMAISYLASNARGLAFQFNSADWSQQRAMAGAQAQYDVASGAMGLTRELANIGIAADMLQTGTQNRNLASQAIINAVAGGVAGVGNALTPGGFAGSALSGVAQSAATGANAAIQTMTNDEALSTRNSQANQTVSAQNRQAALSRDTNVDLARFAARGDYANTVAGINAKIQDANMTQPSVSGQFGGEAFNVTHNLMELNIRWKWLDKASMRRIGEFWLRYGYAIGAFITPPASLKVMSKFTYWKMLETYISASAVPEAHKQVIRGVLEKGVTVWTTPSDIGNIDIADNVPLPGVSY